MSQPQSTDTPVIPNATEAMLWLVWQNDMDLFRIFGKSHGIRWFRGKTCPIPDDPVKVGELMARFIETDRIAWRVPKEGDEIPMSAALLSDSPPNEKDVAIAKVITEEYGR